MVALGLVVETVILVVVAMVYEPQGAKGPFGLVDLLHGGFAGFCVRAFAMMLTVGAIAFAAPALARTFPAGPLLGLVAWAVGIVVDWCWHPSLQGAGVWLLVGGLPAAFVGTTMPMLVRRFHGA